jgi:aspartate/methionine/tyrosine aminotransferase
VFSHRLPADLEPNPLTRAIAALRAAGVPLIDLTASNPTTCGFEYAPGLLEALADPRAMRYDPQPLGLESARETVAAEYARRSASVAPERVVMTASSSDSYSLLFKLLCDPGDSVLVPAPSYPLFEHLAGLDGVTARPYRLEYHGRWTLDVHELGALADARTRAVLAVSPNNPTGSILTRAETGDLHAFCASRGLALIGDEVFCDYLLVPGGDASPSVLNGGEALAISLGGLSKSVGLPQLKLGWMAVGGPEALVGPALQHLEIIADTYLSVATPVQVGLSRLLEHGGRVRQQIADRVLLNYSVLRTLAEDHPACCVLPAEGGWSAVMQGPAIMPDEARAIGLARNAGVIVYPGYFFDFDRDGYVVMSLLVPPAEFRAGASRVLETMEPADS